MSDKEKNTGAPSAAPTDAESPVRPTRRGFLTGIAALGASAAAMGALSGCSSDDDDDSPATPTPDPTPTPTPAPDLTQQLRANVKTVVVIFAENRSFNNLFANFPGVEKPLSALLSLIHI